MSNFFVEQKKLYIAFYYPGRRTLSCQSYYFILIFPSSSFKKKRIIIVIGNYPYTVNIPTKFISNLKKNNASTNLSQTIKTKPPLPRKFIFGVSFPNFRWSVLYYNVSRENSGKRININFFPIFVVEFMHIYLPFLIHIEVTGYYPPINGFVTPKNKRICHEGYFRYVCCRYVCVG